MARNKLTKSDIDKALPPKEKREAIEQSERYVREYELSRKELDEMLSRLEKVMEKLKRTENM